MNGEQLVPVKDWHSRTMYQASKRITESRSLPCGQRTIADGRVVWMAYHFWVKQNPQSLAE